MVYELDPVARKLREGAGQVVDDVADMVERRFRVFGDELRDARIAVGRLEQLDPLALVAEKEDANALIADLVDPFGQKAKRVAEERQRLFDVGDRDGDVVERAELHSRGGT